MRYAAAILASALLGAGCSSMDLASGRANDQDPCDVWTVELFATPEVLVRGESVPISVAWKTYSEPTDTRAVLRVGGNPMVEVEAPLAFDTSADSYTAEILNPFGLGAPGGQVEVEVRGVSPCGGAASAVTVFRLQ